MKTLPQLLRENGYFTSNRDKTDYNFDPEGIWDRQTSEYASWRHRSNGQPFYCFINVGPSHEGTVNNLENYKHFVKDLPAELFHDPAKVRFRRITPTVRKSGRYGRIITISLQYSTGTWEWCSIR